MLIETKTYYLTGGDTTKPFIEIIVTNPALVVVSSSNPHQPGDVEITEVQYYVQVQANETLAKANTDTAAQARLTYVVNEKNLASVALLGIGLTQAQIDIMFSV